MTHLFMRNLKTIGLISLVGLAIIIWFQPYFSGAKLINPVLLHIGSWSIHWYGLLMAVAVLWSWRWLERVARGTKLSSQVLDLVIWLTLGGILGARLMFVVLKWPEFAGHWTDILALTQGGLSIHGALIGGAIAVFIYCRRQKLSFWEIGDLLIIPLITGQIIGRLGNFFNQEAFGGPTSLPWKMWVAPEFRLAGWESYGWFHPTFLYEMIGLGLLLWLISSMGRKPHSAGFLVWLYLIGYSVLRFGIEFYRLDSDKWGALSVAQWGSLVIIMGGIVIGLILRYKRKKL